MFTLLPVLLLPLMFAPLPALSAQGRRAPSPEPLLGLDLGLSPIISSLDNILSLETGTCVRLAAASTVGGTVNAIGQLSGGASLSAGTCLCVEAAANVGLGGIDAAVQVVTSGGVNFTGAAAVNLANYIEGINVGATGYAFAKTDICTELQIGLLNSYHAFLPGAGGCCARACIPGTFRTTSGQCVPSCLSGQVQNPSTGTCTCPTNQVVTSTGTGCACPAASALCNGSCYAKDQYTCPSGVPVRSQGRKRRSSSQLFAADGEEDAASCMRGMTRCAVVGGGVGRSAAQEEEGWECVDTMSDVESCGGCIHPFSTLVSSTRSLTQGEDCSALPNVDRVSCQMGTCIVHTCRKGFVLSDDAAACIPKAPRFGRATNKEKLVRAVRA